MINAVCKCGRKMVLKKRAGTILGNDLFHLYEWESFWLICPSRRWWNCWKHTGPILQESNGS